MGPLIDEGAVADYENAIQAALEQGGKLLYGGKVKRAGKNRRRTFVLPTIIEIENKKDIVQNETFAPVLYVMKYKKIETAFAMQHAVSSHSELMILGNPTFCFAFRSDEFDVYHVNDRMAGNGWRFNGLQNPPALHFCVTGPQTQPGVVERFATDLHDGVAYAREAGDATAACARALVILGGTAAAPFIYTLF